MRYKYPRTFHLPFSEGVSSDDKVLKDISVFDGMDIVMTEKMDGENTTIYRDYIHARSLEYQRHESRSWLMNIAKNFQYLIPEGYRICGENLYAKHSIHYTHLTSRFVCFAIYDHNNLCLSWDQTKYFCRGLGIHTAPEIYTGKFDIEKIKAAFKAYNSQDEVEGYVIRNAHSFDYRDFSKNVAKYVRANHVQTDEHWKDSEIVKNRLDEDWDR